MSEKSTVYETGEIVTDDPDLTLEDLCDACDMSKEQIISYVSEGVIEPSGSGGFRWLFSRVSLITLRRATRLERDLGLNPPGVALALELHEQIEKLKRQLASIEQETSL